MTVLEWLEEVRKRDYAIGNMLDERQKLRDLAERITSGNSDGMPHASGVSDKIGNAAVGIAALEQSISERIVEYTAYRTKVHDTLYANLPALEYQVLSLRYIHFKSWEDISLDMSYSVMQVHRIRVNGLRILEEKLKDVI